MSHRFTDYKALIACEDVEAVLIATPNHIHFDLEMAALQQGKHVILEKPVPSMLQSLPR